MVLNKMETIRAPVNVWNKDSIRPGPVGSVGDALVGVRLRQSAPDMEMRWDKNFSLKNTVYSGSNVSDGYSAGFTTGGGVARTLSTRWPKRQGFKSNVGWIKEDVVPLDRSRTALMGSLGQYSWEAKVGQIARASSTGEMFKPLPEGYTIGQGVQPRGSQIPRIVAESTGEGIALPPTEQKIVDSVFGDNGSIESPYGNQPQGPGSRKQYAYPDVNWVPEHKVNDVVSGRYPYYVWSYGQMWYPDDDLTKVQEVYDRAGTKHNLVFSTDGVIGRPTEWNDKPLPDAPFKLVFDVPMPNTPSQGPIAKPGGWRPEPTKPETKKPEPTKFMGSSYRQTTRIR